MNVHGTYNFVYPKIGCKKPRNEHILLHLETKFALFCALFQTVKECNLYQQCLYMVISIIYSLRIRNTYHNALGVGT